MGKGGQEMSEGTPDIRRLNSAIDSLNDDAESLHSLIVRSTEELERATAEGRRAADVAEEAMHAFGPLSEKLLASIEDAKGLVSEARVTIDQLAANQAEARESDKKAFEAFVSESLKATEGIAVEADKAVAKVTAELKQGREDDREAFDSFTAASLRASEKTRDDLQTDLLSHKTAMAARMDSLEATVDRSVNVLEDSIGLLSKEMKASAESLEGKNQALEKKVALPLYGVIAIAILQLLTLIALFMR